MFERIGTGYIFRDKFSYKSVWRNVKLRKWRTLVARNTTPQKSTENKTDKTEKGANKDENAYKETLKKGRKITQRTKHLNSRKETKQIDKWTIIKNN